MWVKAIGGRLGLPRRGPGRISSIFPEEKCLQSSGTKVV